MNTNRVFTTKEAAERLGISTNMLYRLNTKGKGPCSYRDATGRWHFILPVSQQQALRSKKKLKREATNLPEFLVAGSSPAVEDTAQLTCRGDTESRCDCSPNRSNEKVRFEELGGHLPTDRDSCACVIAPLEFVGRLITKVFGGGSNAA